MALTKEDLGQIKETVKETMMESLVSDPVKKVLKETILEATEPMMIASQKEFEKIGQRFDKMDERFDTMDERFDKTDEKLDDLDKSNNQAHENTSLRLNEVAYKFEIVDLKKRVDVLEQKAQVRA